MTQPRPTVNVRLRALLLAACSVSLIAAAQRSTAEEMILRIATPERVRVSERTNLSRRDDGRYVGLLSRQTDGYLALGADGFYRGRFLDYEQVRRDLDQVGRPVSASAEAALPATMLSLFAAVAADAEGPAGTARAGAAAGPSYRSIPELPEDAVTPGVGWVAAATVVLRPGGSEQIELPVIVEYRYLGVEPYRGTAAHRIEASFATRYPLPPSDDPEAPAFVHGGSVVSVRGTHRLTVMVPIDGTQVLFLRDELQESYRFEDGSERTYTGHALLFVSGLAPSASLAEDVENAIEREGVSDVSVDRTPVGVRLTIRALLFEADRAVLLPLERNRLDAVATALRGVEGVRFLVVGHTAAVGSVESQLELSVERAVAVARELVSRGVSADLIDVEGRGGSEPVGSNDTEEGRARNRRVEIYLLEE